MSERPAYRLRLPGPTAVPERVRQAIAQPVLSHRGPEFTKILRRSEEMLQLVLGTRNRVLFFASSGTGMMEAALVNIIAPGERLLISTHGQFGQRFVEIAKALGAHVDTLDVPWGRAPEPEDVAKRVRAEEYRAFVVVHNESSTGVVADLAGIGAALRDTPTLLVADSVSGLGGIEMRQDAWGVDILASASQKALMCPPGIGILSVSDKARAVVERADRMPRYYWDLGKALKSVERPETPFTTPVALMGGLHEALEMIYEEGLDAVLARHARLSAALRAGCEALGFKAFAETDRLSSTVVCLKVPEPLNGSDIVRTMYQKHGTVIAGSRNHLEGRVIRIGTMGAVSEEDVATDLKHLEQTVQELGGAMPDSAAQFA